MKALIDTHVLLWWVLDDPRLSARGAEILEDGRNDLYVSAASAYEIGVKAGTGRLAIPEPAATYVPSRLAANGLSAMAVELNHALRAASLPPIHRDPWDRLLVAQAQIEGIPIVTADPRIGQYDVKTIW